MPLNARRIRFAAPALLAALAAACAGEAADESTTPLPAQIHGLALTESHAGEEATRILIEMHQSEVVPPENYIGHYGTEEMGAVLYVSRFAATAEADSLLLAMGQRIGPGSSGFGHHTEFTAADRVVHMVFGHGQVHFFYVEERDLTWFAVHPQLARPALAELLKTETDSIPTFEELMMGRPVVDDRAGGS